MGLLVSKVGYRYSDWYGEVNDKKNVVVLLIVFVSIWVMKGFIGGYIYQGNKVVLVFFLVIIGGNEISICIFCYVSY